MVDDGDVVEINYVGRIANTGEIFDLTDQEVADEENLQVDDLGPMKVLLGAEHVITGLEAALRDMDAGDEQTVDIESEDAFGERSGDNVQTISQREFQDHDVTPQRGLVVEIDGRQGKIISTGGGRIRVDFNHPLAGKDLSYDVEVLRVLDDVEEKVVAVLEYYELADRIDVSADGGDVTLELPDEFQQDQVKTMLREEIEQVNGVESVSLE